MIDGYYDDALEECDRFIAETQHLRVTRGKNPHRKSRQGRLEPCGYGNALGQRSTYIEPANKGNGHQSTEHTDACKEQKLVIEPHFITL